MFLTRSLPTLDPSCFPFFLRLLLLFFQKNQILNPDSFKQKLHSDLLRKKRSYDEFNRSKNENLSKNIHPEKKLNYSKIKSNDNFEKPIIKNDNLHFVPSKLCLKSKNTSENIFCFIRKYMRSTALELLNLSEVTNQFVEKLSEINLSLIHI